jgi:glycerol-3-phosphate O-acyltransferase
VSGTVALLASLGAALVAAAGLLALARRALRARARHGWRSVYRALRVRTNRFKLVEKRRLRDDLLKDDEILAAIVAHAKETGGSLAEAEAQVGAYLDEIIPAFDLFTYYRVGLPIASFVLRLIYKLAVWKEDLPDPRRLHRANAVVYIFNHRSNADYVLAAYALRDRVALAFAVGEWARVWPLESLFKAFGSYFVRRGEKSRLYHEVLRRYVQLVTIRGVPQAIFIEGGLSRDGRFREAKVGLLDHIIQCARDPALGKEIVFVPAAINFDRVLEDRSLTAEALARDPATAPPPALPWPRRLRRTLAILFRGSFRLALRRVRKFGYAAIKFGPPVPLRDLLPPDGPSFLALPREQRAPYLKRLAQALLDRVAAQMPVPAVPLVALALEKADFSSGRIDLIERVSHLREALAARGHRLVREDKTDAEIVDYALLLLVARGVLVREPDGLYRVPAAERPIIRYYAASLAHAAPEAVPSPAEHIG